MKKALFLTSFFAGTFLHGLDVYSGGVLSKNQAAMDVKHYGLDLMVDPYKKTISGTSTIKLITAVSLPQRVTSPWFGTLSRLKDISAPSRSQ